MDSLFFRVKKLHKIIMHIVNSDYRSLFQFVLSVLHSKQHCKWSVITYSFSEIPQDVAEVGFIGQLNEDK